MSTPQTIEEPTLEIVWQDAGAYAFVRRTDGTFDDGGLSAGVSSKIELEAIGAEVPARELDAAELIELAGASPAGLAQGASARAIFTLVELAQRSVAEGLVHPQLSRGGTTWYAFWGSTLDDGVQEALAGIAAALPRAAAPAGDRDDVVGALYPHLVDRIARDRLIDAGVKLGNPSRLGRAPALDAFLDALGAPEPDLAPGPSYAALERRLSRWVDAGLAEVAEASWRVGLHLDERTAGKGLALELWLHAADDPTLSLPVSLLEEGGDDAFAFLRSSDPRGDLNEQLAELQPIVAGYGIELDTVTELDDEEVTTFLRELLPQLEERGVPVLLPGVWLERRHGSAPT